MDTALIVAGNSLVVSASSSSPSMPRASLVKNDLFERPGGPRFRLLDVTEDGRTWIINITDGKCWPREWRYADLLAAVEAKEFTVVKYTGEGQPPFRSAAADARLKEAWSIIEPLVKNPAIFHAKLRGPLVAERAESTGASENTINKYLRSYWCGGQSQQALVANFLNIGLKQSGQTHGRGRSPVDERYAVYQMDPKVDVANIKAAVDKHYLTGDVSTLKHAYVEMLIEDYSFLDGNGKRHIKDSGERPSMRQFRTVVKRHYSIETILRRKKGDRDFERDHNHNISGALFEARCVGHIYEIDATIADVYLVAQADRSKIIGKPTLYLIYDRFSRLCVGFYVGLEHPGWEAAMQAILSIAEDKAALCQKYGIDYDPADWPAHGMFPQKFLGDCGEMISRNSNRICAGMESTISNAPPLTPQNKGTVECGFKLLHQSIAALTPGYEPARNLMRRRGKHYDRDASLTLDEFIAIVLAAIIKHNRTPMGKYRMLPAMALREVPPTPREIWADDQVNGAGILSRFTEEYLHFQLLPRDKATVTENGVLFKNCYYSCKELEKLGWFITADNRGRWDIQVSFDRRLVDRIVAHDAKNPRKSYVCELSPRSKHFKGYSFAEVAFVVAATAEVLRDGEDEALRERARLHQTISDIAKPARWATKKASKGKSRTSRKSDIADDRNSERATRRRDEAAIKLPSPNDVATALPDNVVSLHSRPSASDEANATPAAAGTDESATESTREPTWREKLRQMRKELVNGLTN
ncbi:transcriptional antiterminator [Paraburkholderia sp. SIMBA_049]